MSIAWSMNRGVVYGSLRRQLQLAREDLVAGQPTADPIAKEMYSYYGDEFTIECPTGSGHHMNLWDVANEIVRRLGNIFLCDAQGRRPVYGQAKKFQTDPVLARLDPVL